MKNEEHQIQKNLITLVKHAEYQFPELSLLYAIPNGGHRHIATASKMKAEGVRAGIPDLCLPIARGEHNALYIEMKTMKGRVQPSQTEMMAALEEAGNKCIVCRTAGDAFNELVAYLESGENE